MCRFLHLCLNIFNVTSRLSGTRPIIQYIRSSRSLVTSKTKPVLRDWARTLQCSITKHEHEWKTPNRNDEPRSRQAYVLGPGRCLPSKGESLCCYMNSLKNFKLPPMSPPSGPQEGRRLDQKGRGRSWKFQPQESWRICEITKCKQTFSSSYTEDIKETYKPGSAASARAAPLPFTPTEIPQIRLHTPTVIPPQKTAYPV